VNSESFTRRICYDTLKNDKFQSLALFENLSVTTGAGCELHFIFVSQTYCMETVQDGDGVGKTVAEN